MNKDLEKIIIDETKLKHKIKELGMQLKKEYKNKNPIFVCILRGGAMFLSDLIREVNTDIEIDFMSVSSYGNSTESSGIVKIRKDIDTDIKDRHVIIIEDIVDTGLTLKYISEYLTRHNPASVKICSLLDKVEARKIEINVDYVGFEIENEFVVGYGIDYAEKYRNLPYIGVVKKELYS